MHITLLEPFFAGSHAAWATEYKKFSAHDITILSLKGRHWKWRMYGGGIKLASVFLEQNIETDLILATDMLNLNDFLAHTRRKTAHLPTAFYFHENQLTYPWSAADADVQLKRDRHYSFINYTSSLAADKVFYNSRYHLESFLGALPNFLRKFPDHKGKQNIKQIADKSEVLHLGMNLKKFDVYKMPKNEKLPLILWNHRWEYDKKPADFFRALYILKEKGLRFEVAILGENYNNKPACFEEAKTKLADEIVHFGYAESFEDYAHWLWKADILPVTSNQDFFGGSVVEAMYANCYPILPNRLAYPEHLPKQLHKKHYFKNFEQLVQMLTYAIENIETIRTQDFDFYVKKYDWTEIVGKYDAVFKQLSQNFH
ncbi:MAG: tRNA-queuosine alpha-mannosyltransferase domain-containing protein [Chitinophagales bacterium]